MFFHLSSGTFLLVETLKVIYSIYHSWFLKKQSRRITPFSISIYHSSAQSLFLAVTFLPQTLSSSHCDELGWQSLKETCKVCVPLLKVRTILINCHTDLFPLGPTVALLAHSLQSKNAQLIRKQGKWVLKCP